MPTQPKDADLVVSYLTMRRAIGWLGMLLPFALLIGNFGINQLDIPNNSFFIDTACQQDYRADHSFKSSISHYYYSTVGELFTGTLSIVALFLFCYKGHVLRPGEKGLSENLMANLARLFALGVVVFPTASDECINDNMRSFLSSNNTGNIHFAMATLFFVSLAIMSTVNFRRTQKVGIQGTNKEDDFYLICGIAMIVCLLLIVIYSIWIQELNIEWLNRLQPIFCLEAVALIFFGLSWPTKGNIDYYYEPKKLKLMK